MMASASRSLISSVAAAVARRSILFHDRSTSLEQPRPAPPAPYRGGAGGVGAVEREYNFTVRAATGPDRSHCEHRRRRGRRMINRIGPSDAMTHRTFGFRVSAPQWSAAAGSSSGCSIGRPYTACQGMTNGRPAVRATWTVAGLACTAASCFRSVGGLALRGERETGSVVLGGCRCSSWRRGCSWPAVGGVGADAAAQAGGALPLPYLLWTPLRFAFFQIPAVDAADPHHISDPVTTLALALVLLGSLTWFLYALARRSRSTSSRTAWVRRFSCWA